MKRMLALLLTLTLALGLLAGCGIESSTRDIVNLTTVAVVDAIVQEQIEKEG